VAITEIQSNIATSGIGASTTPAVSWPSTPAAGNLLYCVVACDITNGDVTISPPSGWLSSQSWRNLNNVRQAFFYKTAGASESGVVQATISVNRAWIISIIEVHTTDPGGWLLDKLTQTAGTSTSPISGNTATTTKAEEWWVAGISCRLSATLTSPTNSFVIKQQSAQTYLSSALLTRIVAATGAAQAGGTYASSMAWVGGADTFMAQGQTVTATGANLTGLGSLEARANYATPTMIVQAAFGYGATDPLPVWTNISSYVRTFTWQRGKQNELNQLTAGTGTVILNDPNSHFDPSNTASPFYPNVKPGLPVRAILFVGASMYPLFYGFAERLPRTQRVTSVYTQRQIDLVDGFTQLAYAGLAGDTYPQQTADQRVAQVLDNVQWPTTRRRIGTATTTLQAITFAGEDDTRAQQHLQAVDDSEAGLLYVDGGNTLVFVGRNELAQPPYGISQATFGDLASANVYPYTELVPSYDLDQVFNRWTVTREDGSPQTAEDTNSQAAYFLRAKQTATLHSDDAQALALAQLKLTKFAEPLNRIETLTIMPLTSLTNTAQIAAGFARGLGDRITITETPPGFGAAESHEYVIQQINGQIDVGPLTSASLTFGVWPVLEEAGALIIGSSHLDHTDAQLG
jgi:hypothetical protein